ncbi:MAG TPA: APC family permease [Solirubrobacteraceae bacterium]|nr:APC family permease [Solirubrobacteraceae bacterium]
MSTGTQVMDGNRTTLERDAVGVGGIVFLVLAAAAPMAAVVGAMPVGVALGDGAGFPGSFLVAAIVLLLFAVGYAAMSRHVTNAGAFYSYVTRGLGRDLGSAAGYVALVAYNAMAIALSAAVGYFAHVTFQSEFSINLPWAVWWLIAVAIVALLAYREITLTARALGVALGCEVLILLVFDAAVLVNHGFHGFSTHDFSPSTVFSGAVGVALTYAFASFVGFEATAIYGEEARNPHRTVARATYIALAIIAVFYTLTTWAAVSSYGASHAQAAAAKDPSSFVFAANLHEVGKFTTDVMQVLVVTSIFAGFLAFHQAASRYMFALSRDGLLPRQVGRVHPVHRSPFVASIIQILLVVLVVGLLGLAGEDPYLQISVPILGFGTLGVILLQASASVSVVAFFRRRQDPRAWTTLVAPALGSAGLTGSAILVCINFGALTTSTSTLVKLLPWLYLLAAAVGGTVAIWLRRSRPHLYRQMAANHGVAEALGGLAPLEVSERLGV